MPVGRPLTEAQRRAIVAEYAAGERPIITARRFFIHRSHVSKLAKRAGVKKPKHARRHPQEMAILEDYRAGERTRDIAEKYHVHVATVQRIGARNDSARRVGRKRTRINATAIAEAYKAGEKLAVIAVLFGVHTSTARTIARRHGVPARRWIQPQIQGEVS